MDALLASVPVEIDESTIGPGLLGFLVFAGLAIAVVVLFRSLRSHLRKIDIPTDSSDPH